MEATMPKPWYKTPYVWMLIGIPMFAVVAGIITIIIAVKTDDGLVKDDYYTHGKQINRVIERDKAAARHGLTAKIIFDYAAGTVTARLASKNGYVIPTEVTAELLHATRAGHDQVITLQRTAEDSHFSALPLLAKGHWIVQLSADDWRISGDLYIPGDTTIYIQAD